MIKNWCFKFKHESQTEWMYDYILGSECGFHIAIARFVKSNLHYTYVICSEKEYEKNVPYIPYEDGDDDDEPF